MDFKGHQRNYSMMQGMNDVSDNVESNKNVFILKG